MAAGHAVPLSDPELLMYWYYRLVGFFCVFSMNTFSGDRIAIPKIENSVESKKIEIFFEIGLFLPET